jgi:arginine deiminase
MDKELQKVDIDAFPGERWFPKESLFEDDMPLYWGDWGVASEVDELKAVLLRRPGKEPAGNPRCKAELEKHGVEVISIDFSEILKGWGAIHCATAFLKRE